jgi:hypothetical protein
VLCFATEGIQEILKHAAQRIEGLQPIDEMQKNI